MKEKINPIELANQSKEAKANIERARTNTEEAQKESLGAKKTVNENLDILAHEASMDYLSKLKQDLTQAIDKNDTNGARLILDNIDFHQKSMKEHYDAKARKNIESYFDKATGEVDMEKLKEELDSFMAEIFLTWYGEKEAKKAKISGEITDLSKIDYKKLEKTDPSLYGEYTINPETAGMDHQEKEPKLKIIDMEEFIGQPRLEVMKAVIEKYSGKYHIPGLEYEKYLLENPDKVPNQLKDGNWYYFMGSVLRDRDGGSGVPYVRWDGGELDRRAGWLGRKWGGSGRVLLFEK